MLIPRLVSFYAGSIYIYMFCFPAETVTQLEEHQVVIIKIPRIRVVRY